jgi:hypothetical protein
MAGPVALRGGGAWSWNEVDTSRAVIFPGFFEREKTSYDADTGQIFGEVAYPIVRGRTALEPFAGLAYVSIDPDTFRENGALAGLRGSGDDLDVGYSTLGLRAAATMAWNSVTVTPHVSAAWQHAFDDVRTGARSGLRLDRHRLYRQRRAAGGRHRADRSRSRPWIWALYDRRRLLFGAVRRQRRGQRGSGPLRLAVLTRAR